MKHYSEFDLLDGSFSIPDTHNYFELLKNMKL